jgi:hypothetical protein
MRQDATFSTYFNIYLPASYVENAREDFRTKRRPLPSMLFCVSNLFMSQPFDQLLGIGFSGMLQQQRLN